MTTEAQLQAMMEKFIADVLEHAQSIRIVITFEQDSDTTAILSQGGGNFYAQLESIKTWLRNVKNTE